MPQVLDWNFISTGGGDMDGLNNSMIEHFTGNYNYFLAREIIQNSLDAKADENIPVKVKFSLEYITKGNFLGYNKLLEILSSAKNLWKHHNETLTFLDNAIKCLNLEKIPFLRISDFNTKGLSGTDDDMQGGWFNLVRSTGASSKSSGEGGSFGIGKGAPFAASDLRTVFYSTQNEKAFCAFQGKAELVSFKNKDNDTQRGVCSYGIGQNSVRNFKNIPSDFWRKIQGTDIIIAGYKITNDWVEDLLKSVLRNFWYAIHCKDLEVEIENYEIRSDNLSEYLVNYFIDEPFKDYVEPTGNPLQYYLAVVQGEELGKEKKLKILGDCKFYFKLIESHMNYVAMLRKTHMVIYSRRFNFPGHFAGVFICDNKKGNIALRKMEPPAHDKWDPKRNKDNGEAVMNEMTSFIRSCLDSVKQQQSFGILEIPGLQKYLPYDEGDDTGGGNGTATYTGNEGKEETSKLIQKTEKLNANVVITPQKISVLNERNSFGTVGGKGGKGGKGGEANGEKMNKKIKKFNSRSFLVKKALNNYTYRTIIHSQEELKCNLNFIAVGEEGVEKIKIINVSDKHGTKYFFSGNKIQQIKLLKEEIKSFDIVIESPFKLSLKAEAYEL